LAWLIVEGGIGEELAGRLNDVEFLSNTDVGSSNVRSIEELSAHVLRVAGEPAERPDRG
jgi:hypothetical protein